jgi:hypothetical protein
MGTSSRLATLLDYNMLRANNGIIYPAGTPLTAMCPLQPNNPGHPRHHLHQRCLMRYLLPN